MTATPGAAASPGRRKVKINDIPERQLRIAKFHPIILIFQNENTSEPMFIKIFCGTHKKIINLS